MRQLRRKIVNSPAKQSQAAEGEPTARHLCEKPRVLVVDDDHRVRIMMQLGLEQNAFDM